jgi:serine/threonine protein kinase
MALQEGFILHDRYQIGGQLGRGGMGTVYLAQDLSLQIQVAVKENLNTNPESERQFQREASLLANLRHSNLPRVTDHFIIDEKQYLVMDYVEGEDLDNRFSRKRPSVDEVLGWAVSISDALIYIHSRQPPIIHRDIKPANIKLHPDGNLMLVDFGIAKVFDSQQTTTGARGLTPGYSPPEQYGGSITDHRSDQYSLGATIYEMLTGQRPIDSIERMFNKKQLQSIQSLNPAVPVHIDIAVSKALSLDPEDRFQSLAQFKAALQEDAQDATILSDPTFILPVEAPAQSATIHQDFPGLSPPEALPKIPKPWQKFVLPALAVVTLAVGAILLLSGNSDDNQSIQPSATSPLVGALPSQTTAPIVIATSLPSSTPQPTETTQPTTPPPTSTPTLTPVSIGGGGLIAFSSDRGEGGLLQIWTMYPDGSNLAQLTFGPGNKSQPRWYSDGRRIAFVSDEDGNREIYLMNPDGSHRINLTNNPNDDYDPAWSPDGTTLAFTTTRYIGQTQVYLLPISCTSIEEDCVPGEARSLSRGYADEFFPAWAPPDMQMPYWMPQDQPLAVSISINQAPKRLFFRSEDTGNPPIWFDVQDRILGVHDLRWSPDGQRIIFTWFYDGKNEIYALPIADRGNNWIKLTNSLGNQEPSISPDSQWIVFTSTRDQNPEIYLMKIDGSDQINLTNKLGRDVDPDWQPPTPD